MINKISGYQTETVIKALKEPQSGFCFDIEKNTENAIEDFKKKYPDW